MASALKSGSRRSSNGFSVMNIEPRFEPMALSTNERPGLPRVWATPGVSRAIFSTARLTSAVRSSDADRAVGC